MYLLYTHIVRQRGSLGIDGCSTITTPGVVVAHIINEHILVRLGAKNVPVVAVVQESVPMVLQFCWSPLHLKPAQNLNQSRLVLSHSPSMRC